jgi:hypothetical protein
MVTTGLPTLSQILSWDVDHLVTAADHWTATADQWDDIFGQVWQQSLGLDWDGEAADALRDRTYTDKMTVTSRADQLRDASTVARQGVGDIDSAKRRVLYAIEDAYDAGFDVGEDLSVTDTESSGTPAELASRQAQAQALAADIRQRAAALVGVDSDVGTNLTQTAGDVGDTTFAENPINYDRKPIDVGADPRNGTIQLAGHGFKLDGGAPPPPPQPGFIDQWEQQLTSAGPQAPPPPIPMPSSGAPPPPFVPQAPGPMPTYVPPPSFGQCVGSRVKENVGEEMIKGGFESAVEYAVKGAVAGGAGGAAITPEIAGVGGIPGALGGGVLGFVGGFMKGIIEAPVKSALKGAWDCVTQ